MSNGCGGILRCGSCSSSYSCGLFHPNVCGTSGTYFIELNGSAGIKNDHTRWSWGNDIIGPRQVDTADDWKHFHTCGIKLDGTLWCNGAQVGTDNDWTFTDGSCGLRAGGHLSCWGEVPAPASTVMDTSKTWRTVAHRGDFMCAISTVGELHCWGNRTRDQEGGPPTTEHVDTVVPSAQGWQSLDLGDDYACAIRGDGTLWCFRWNTGSGPHMWDALMGPVTQVSSDTDWASVAAGYDVSCALRTNGTLWCWGDNQEYGGVGDGTRLPRTSPVAIAPGTSWLQVSALERGMCAIRSDHTTWCWGSNRSGQLGIGTGTRYDAHIEPGTTWRSVTTNGSTFGIRSDGTLWAWGPGIDRPEQLAPDTDWQSVGASGCGVKTDGSLWCVQPGHAPVRIGTSNAWTSVGNGTCGVNAGSIYCWKEGEQPQVSQSPPVFSNLSMGFDVACAMRSGTMVQCWDWYYTGVPDPPVTIADEGWSKVSVGGSDKICGLKRHGTVWCWSKIVGSGYDVFSAPTYVPLPMPATDITSGGNRACAITLDGRRWCWGYNDGVLPGPSILATPTPVGSTTGWTAITSGDGVLCGIRTSGELYCSGRYRGDGFAFSDVPVRLPE